MLRITQNNAASAAVKYFDEGLTKSDYYSEKNEITGIWGGLGASALNLNGSVTKHEFYQLCYNINPQTDERLTARNDAKRTTGYDFTFSVPKSVSIVHSLTHDPDIMKALNIAINSTMAEIETNAETRVRKNKAMQNRTTGNLIWAAFTHEDARPVNGIPDPHLHQHVFVFNATFDSQEKQWKAGQFRNIKAEATYYEALFNNHLAYELKKAGYSLERGAHNFEIAGFQRSTIEKFSNRTLEVNKKAEEL
jgi:conjugative relaxase-like TrwC/TraI family protein